MNPTPMVPGWIKKRQKCLEDKSLLENKYFETPTLRKNFNLLENNILVNGEKSDNSEKSEKSEKSEETKPVILINNCCKNKSLPSIPTSVNGNDDNIINNSGSILYKSILSNEAHVLPLIPTNITGGKSGVKTDCSLQTKTTIMSEIKPQTPNIHYLRGHNFQINNKSEYDMPKINKQILPKIAHSPKPKIIIPYDINDDINDDIEDNTEDNIFDPDIDDIYYNPWMPEIIKNASDVKIASYTPFGNIAMVPTSNRRPETPIRLTQTPRRQSIKKLVKEQDEEIDPIINATIILDCTKSEDRPYDYVSNRMKSIIAMTASLKGYHKHQLMPCPDIFGPVNYKDFDTLLSIYENNQVYYQDCLDNNLLTEDQIKHELSKLEFWFICIIEPHPVTQNGELEEDEYYINKWKDREINKLVNGYSSYCDPELYQYITPLPNNIKLYLNKHKIK